MSLESAQRQDGSDASSQLTSSAFVRRRGPMANERRVNTATFARSLLLNAEGPT